MALGSSVREMDKAAAKHNPEEGNHSFVVDMTADRIVDTAVEVECRSVAECMFVADCRPVAGRIFPAQARNSPAVEHNPAAAAHIHCIVGCHSTVVLGMTWPPVG